jgi:hypothetical protein
MGGRAGLYWYSVGFTRDAQKHAVSGGRVERLTDKHGLQRAAQSQSTDYQ